MGTATRETLSDMLEFDHPVIVHADGTVSDAVGVYAPEVYEDGDASLPYVNDGWELLDGYSGQCGYSGPVMHPSEFVGGRLADDVLSEPGIYVVTAVCDPDDGEAYGWVVARRAEDGAL